MERRLFLSSATFVHSDTSTGGNWTGVYGADGYSIVNGNTSLPSYAQVSATNALNWTWATDARGLQTSPGAATRIDSCDFSETSFNLNVSLSDGQGHQVAIYMLDWESNRSQTVTVKDAATNAVLDSENVSNFANGKWLV